MARGACKGRKSSIGKNMKKRTYGAIAANHSMTENKPMRIDDLISFPTGVNFLHELRR
jgi:hypothetical protein